MYHKELIKYIPYMLQDIREYKAILEDGEQEKIDILWQNLEDTLNNQFVESANEAGVRRYEKILNISPKTTATLEERKFTILTFHILNVETRITVHVKYVKRKTKNALWR